MGTEGAGRPIIERLPLAGTHLTAGPVMHYAIAMASRTAAAARTAFRSFPMPGEPQPMSEANHTEPAGLSPHRIDALTDGIYAVAMTLLVIELKLPEHGAIHSHAEFAQAVVELWPRVM